MLAFRDKIGTTISRIRFRFDPNTAYSDEHFLQQISVQLDDSDLYYEISEDEIIRRVRSLRGSCATGVDGLSMEMFECTLDVILPYLKQLFNCILNTGNYL